MGVSAVVHTGLAFYAARLAWTHGGASSGGDSGKQSMAAELMGHPAGQWLVGAVGLAIVGAGIAHVVKGWKAGFLKYFKETPRWWVNVCRFGLAARGVVFLQREDDSPLPGSIHSIPRRPQTSTHASCAPRIEP